MNWIGNARFAKRGFQQHHVFFPVLCHKDHVGCSGL
jgi:hypothetical protein